MKIFKKNNFSHPTNNHLKRCALRWIGPMSKKAWTSKVKDDRTFDLVESVDNGVSLSRQPHTSSCITSQHLVSILFYDIWRHEFIICFDELIFFFLTYGVYTFPWNIIIFLASKVTKGSRVVKISVPKLRKELENGRTFGAPTKSTL